MFIINELLTSVTYTGNGTQTNFDIPFDYLRKSFVFASINNEATSDFTIDGRTLIFNEAPAEEAIIVIYRKTDTKPLVSWADASVFRSGDMTISQVQQLHIIEEGQDWSRTNSVVLEDDVYNMRFHRVTNVADPVEENDVVTKGYMESVQGGFVQQNTALKDEATKQAGIATTKAGEASASASAAKTSETNAQKWAESPESPDGQEDSESPTGETMSAKEWTKYAKQLILQINPDKIVTGVKEENGSVNVEKGDGTSDSFDVVTSVNGIKPKNGNVDVAGIPVGFEFFTLNPEAETGVLQYLGGEYSRETYKDLWEVIEKQPKRIISESEWQEKAAANNGNVPFYSTGDGSTTFRVPSVKCWVKGANETGEIGKYLLAGMPNITGQIPAGTYHQSSANRSWEYGAFRGVNDNSYNSGDVSGSGYKYRVAMDASRSNAIFGNADTVQPESIVGVWCVKAFGTVSNVGNQDVTELSAEVTRVGTQVNEVADSVKGMIDYVIESSYTENGWYRKYKSGRLVQGGKAVAPGDSGAIGTVTLFIPFIDNKYDVIPGTYTDGENGSIGDQPAVYNKTTTNFKTRTGVSGTYYTPYYVVWVAEGRYK